MKPQLLQVGIQHAQALKDVAAAGEAKVEEAKKQFAEAEGQLRRELEEENELRKLEQDQNAELAANQASLGEMIKDIDTQALSKRPFPSLASFHIFTGVCSYRLLLIFSQSCSRTPKRAHATVTKLPVKNLVPDADAPWTARDHLAVMYSRITHMRVIDRHLSELPEAALKNLQVPLA
jgi:hypothetical protein